MGNSSTTSFYVTKGDMTLAFHYTEHYDNDQGMFHDTFEDYSVSWTMDGGGMLTDHTVRIYNQDSSLTTDAFYTWGADGMGECVGTSRYIGLDSYGNPNNSDDDFNFQFDSNMWDTSVFFFHTIGWGWWREHCDKQNASSNNDGGQRENETYSQSNDSTLTLRTGGKILAQRLNLLCLNGSAARETFWWEDRVNSTIDPTQIMIYTGNLGFDGNLWTTLSDCDTVDVTPKVDGEDYYGYGVKWNKSQITLTANNINMDTNTPEFCVGQKVNFILKGFPEGTTTFGHWMFSPKFVNDWTNNSAGCTNYSINFDKLTNLTTSCWFVNKSDGGSVTAAFDVTFTNGQTVFISKRGSVDVYRPTAEMMPFNAEESQREFVIYPYSYLDIINFTFLPPPINPTTKASKISYGDDTKPYGPMQYRVKVTTTTNFNGQAGITQLCDLDYSNPAFWCKNYLDGNDEFYNYTVPIVPVANAGNIIYLSDTPSSIWLTPNKLIGSYRDYVRFRPDGDVNNIYVTLGIVTWNMNAVGEWVPFTEDTWILTTDEHPAPKGPDKSDDFPVWDGVKHSKD